MYFMGWMQKVFQWLVLLLFSYLKSDSLIQIFVRSMQKFSSSQQAIVEQI